MSDPSRPASGRIRRGARWLIVLLLVLGVGGGVGEGAARLFVRSVLGLPALHRFDPDVGWTLRPNVDLETRTRDGDTISIRTNEAGYRSPALAAARTVPRLVLLGDSNVFGTGVSAEARFDTALRNQRFRGEPLEVVNTAVSGWGIDQALVLYERERARLQADIVVLFAHENDLVGVGVDRHSGYWKPRFQLGPAGQLERVPVEGGRWISRVRRSSDLVGLVATVAAALEAPPVRDRKVEAVLMAAIVRRVARLAREDAASFGLVVQSRTRLAPAISGEWKAPLLSVAREEGFPVVDLDPTLDSGAGIEGHFFEADPLH